MIFNFFKNSPFRLVASCAAAVCVFTSCARPGDYKGYQMRGYDVRGRHYEPMSVEEALNYQETGTCSWYNESKFFGLKRGTTSLGEKVMPWHLIGAHKTLPLPSLVEVTDLESGKKIKVRVNDRGPFVDGRIIDLSKGAAEKLGIYRKGVARVRVRYLGPAPETGRRVAESGR